MRRPSDAPQNIEPSLFRQGLVVIRPVAKRLSQAGPIILPTPAYIKRSFQVFFEVVERQISQYSDPALCARPCMCPAVRRQSGRSQLRWQKLEQKAEYRCAPADNARSGRDNPVDARMGAPGYHHQASGCLERHRQLRQLLCPDTLRE